MGEQSRARYPDATGIVERSGGRIGYEIYGRGDPAIMFVPPWAIVHSRIWKAQIPYFARRHRVIAWDARGNGRSDRPQEPAAHADHAIAADLMAVLDATNTGSAVLVGLSGAAIPAVIAASEHPERVLGLVLIAPSVPLGNAPSRMVVPFDAETEIEDGWAKHNIHFWRRDFRRYLEFFFDQAFSEPHSTKPIEDGVDYGRSTDPETLGATVYAPGPDTDAFRALCRSIQCPTLVIHGDRDRISHVSRAIDLAGEIPGAELILLEGSGHIPTARDPVRVNLLIREFVQGLA